MTVAGEEATRSNGDLQQGDNPQQQSTELKPPSALYGARHTQALLLFTLITLAYAMRVNISVGIVAMTDPSTNPNPDIPVYQWTNNSVILSAFFWGYVITNVIAGQLVKKFGAKWFLVGSMLGNSLFALLTPVMASLGSEAVIVCRIVQGLSQGFFYASCHTMMAKWVPPSERSRISTFVYAGGPFGTVISYPSTGWIAASSVGWPYAFYLYGTLGLLWSLAWALLGHNSPEDHPRIDPEEKRYIQMSLDQTGNKAPPPTPWKAILTSLPMWAILIAHAGQNWGFSTLLTNTPTYMKYVLNYDLSKSGLLAAGPYFTFWVLSFLFSFVTDYIIGQKICSVGTARKIANSIGLLVPAGALLTLGLISSMDDPADLTLALLFIAVGVNSCCFCGYNVNHIDLSPNHAGTLMGLTNGTSNIFSIIAPLIIQFIVTDQKNASQWAIIFYIASAVYVAGNTFFVIFASGDLQPWDSYKQTNLSIIPVSIQTKEEESKNNTAT